MKFEVTIPDVMLVFDDVEWERAGYDQPEGNEQFWHPATLLNYYQGKFPGEWLADVKFHHDNHTSRGHFIHLMRELPV